MWIYRITLLASDGDVYFVMEGMLVNYEPQLYWKAEELAWYLTPH
jgi:hypothetical protein